MNALPCRYCLLLIFTDGYWPFDYATDQVDERYGLAKVATLIDSVRQATPNLLLLDAGDFLQGNQLAEYYAREDASSPNHPLLAAMELLEFDATVVGNHEFNFGVPYLDKTYSTTFRTRSGW